MDLLSYSCAKPVLVQGEPVQGGDSLTDSPTSECATEPGEIYKNSNAKWLSVNGPVNVSTVNRELRYRNNQKPQFFDAPAIYNSDVKGIDMKTNLAGRKNELLYQKDLTPIEDLTPLPSEEAVKNSFDEIGHGGIVATTKDRFNKTRDFIDNYKIIFGILTFILAFAFVNHCYTNLGIILLPALSFVVIFFHKK